MALCMLGECSTTEPRPQTGLDINCPIYLETPFTSGIFWNHCHPQLSAHQFSASIDSPDSCVWFVMLSGQFASFCLALLTFLGDLYLI